MQDVGNKNYCNFLKIILTRNCSHMTLVRRDRNILSYTDFFRFFGQSLHTVFIFLARWKGEVKFLYFQTDIICGWSIIITILIFFWEDDLETLMESPGKPKHLNVVQVKLWCSFIKITQLQGCFHGNMQTEIYTSSRMQLILFNRDNKAANKFSFKKYDLKS